MARKGEIVSDETRRRMSEAANKRWTPQARQEFSESLLQSGIRSLPRGPHTEERRAAISESVRKTWAAKGGNPDGGFRNFSGGAAGEIFASCFLPAGFTREKVVQWSVGVGGRCKLDFAHLPRMLNVELDGPGHDSALDVERDKRLRHLGWCVVRIQHIGVEVFAISGKFDIDKINLRYVQDLLVEHPNLRLSLQLHKLLGVQ